MSCRLFFFFTVCVTLSLGLRSCTGSSLISCGPLKHIVAVPCDLLSVLRAFFLCPLVLHRSARGCEMTGKLGGRGERRVQRFTRSDETKRSQRKTSSAVALCLMV